MLESDHWHSRLSIKQLRRRLMSMPMLLLLVFLVGGILLADYVVLPLVVVAVSLCCLIVVGCIASQRAVSRVYIAVAMVLLGYLLVELRMPYASMPYDRALEMVVDVVGIPSQRDGYRVAEGRVVRWREHEEWQHADDKVLLWLRDDTLQRGDRFVVGAEVRSRLSRHEEYARLLRSRGYVGGIGVDTEFVVEVDTMASVGLHHGAVAKMERYRSDSLSHATALAMVTGERSAMPRMLREAYSATGLSHLLAVSGLHLGVVLMVVMMLLAPLRLIHGGHRLEGVLTVVAIWIFVVMSGASASVVRAAIMLTMLLLANIISSSRNSVNILALTLFAMLVYRPGYLYDVSFQLSGLAVAGILFWGVPIIGRMWHMSWVWRMILTTIVIGVVATLWTLPVVSHTFGNLPLAGIVITPVVLLATYMVVGCGLFVLLLPAPLAQPFAWVCEWFAGVQNSVVLWCAEHGITGVEYAMSRGEVALCYVIYAVVTLLVWSISREKEITLS